MKQKKQKKRAWKKKAKSTSGNVDRYYIGNALSMNDKDLRIVVSVEEKVKYWMKRHARRFRIF